MNGPVALVGADEFLPAMAALDAELLAATGRRRPRVAILPTASAPDGEETFRRWAAMGIEHFSGLGAETEAVLVRDRAEADDPANVQAVAEADLVYLSGGDPGHLLRALAGSAVWSAALDVHRRGGVLAGCSAGAMVAVRDPGPLPPAAPPARCATSRLSAWCPGVGRVPALRPDARGRRGPVDGPRAARHGHPRDRRGDGGGRSRRRLAGPGPWPGDRLAGPAPGAPARRGRLPDLTSAPVPDGRRRHRPEHGAADPPMIGSHRRTDPASCRDRPLPDGADAGVGSSRDPALRETPHAVRIGVAGPEVPRPSREPPTAPGRYHPDNESSRPAPGRLVGEGRSDRRRSPVSDPRRPAIASLRSRSQARRRSRRPVAAEPASMWVTGRRASARGVGPRHCAAAQSAARVRKQSEQ